MPNHLGYVILFTLILWIGRASAAPVVGYGSSNAIVSSRTQELFLMGFETGFDAATRTMRPPLKDALIIDQSTDGGQLGAIKSVRRLLSKGILALAGFPSSHDALLAGQVMRGKQILMLSAGAGHSKMADLGDTIFTTGESSHQSARTVLDLIDQRFPGRSGLIVSNPYAAFSIDQEEALHAEIAKRGVTRISTIHLRDDLTLAAEDLEAIRRKHVGFLVLTAYADDMPRFLNQMSDAHVDLPIITNNWTTSDVDIIRRSLTKRRAPVYALTIWDQRTADYRRFRNLITERFGKHPTPEMASGFDVGTVLGQTIRDARRPLSAESILKAFRARRCFDHTAAGTICFGRHGGFAEREISIVRFTKHGLASVQ